MTEQQNASTLFRPDIVYPALNFPVRYSSGSVWLFKNVPDEDNRFAKYAIDYDDDLTRHYSYDSDVPNHKNVQAGDFVLVRDRNVLLGSAIVTDIRVRPAIKKVLACPRCGASNTKLTKYSNEEKWRCDGRCQKDGLLVEERYVYDPIEKEYEIKTYTAYFGDSWSDLAGALGREGIQDLVEQGKWNANNSIMKLDSLRTQYFLDTLHFSSRHNLSFSETGELQEISNGGFVMRRAKVRIGQPAFRAHLVRQYGPVCAFSGVCHMEALDAAHLYSYAKTGKHYKEAGLLLRKDLHRLFDKGLITVRDNLRLDLHPDLRRIQYGTLQDKKLQVEVSRQAKNFLHQHREENISNFIKFN